MNYFHHIVWHTKIGILKFDNCLNLPEVQLIDSPKSQYNNIYKLIKNSFDEQLVSDIPFCLLLCNPRTNKIFLNYTLDYCKNRYINKLNIYVLHCMDSKLKGLEVNLEENTISKSKENIDIEVNTIFINDSNIDSILSTVCNDIKQKYNICISDIAIDKLFKANEKYNINLVKKIFKFGRNNRPFCEISIFKCQAA